MSKLRRKIDELLGNVPEEVIEIHYINPITGEVTIWFSSPAATGKPEIKKDNEQTSAIK